MVTLSPLLPPPSPPYRHGDPVPCSSPSSLSSLTAMVTLSPLLPPPSPYSHGDAVPCSPSSLTAMVTLSPVLLPPPSPPYRHGDRLLPPTRLAQPGAAARPVPEPPHVWRAAWARAARAHLAAERAASARAARRRLPLGGGRRQRESRRHRAHPLEGAAVPKVTTASRFLIKVVLWLGLT